MTILSPHTELAISTGSITGREHTRLYRCNQDALAWRAESELAVAAVADGCSSGRYSEVGARLAVGWTTRHAPAIAGGGTLEADAALALCEGLLAFLGEIACGLTADQVPSPEVIQDYFLFTLLVALVGPRSVLVFGVGDGLVSLNGVPRSIPSGTDNQPDYLGYALLSGSRVPESPGPESPALVIHHHVAAAQLQSLVLATDGASALPSAELVELETATRFTRNPSLVQKRLNVLGGAGGSLWDDTSVVLIRRVEG